MQIIPIHFSSDGKLVYPLIETIPEIAAMATGHDRLGAFKAHGWIVALAEGCVTIAGEQRADIGKTHLLVGLGRTDSG